MNISELIERSNMHDEDIRVTKLKMIKFINTYNNTVVDFTTAEDCYFMDFENWILENIWDQNIKCLRGLKRLNNFEWINIVFEYIDLPEINFSKYKTWVRQGNGDDWLLDESD